MSPQQRASVEKQWAEATKDIPLPVLESLAALEEAIRETLKRLSQVTFRGPRILALCPFHDDQQIGSFMLRMQTGWYKCYACGASGGLAKLMRHVGMEDLDIRAHLKHVDFKALAKAFLAPGSDPFQWTLPEGLLDRYRGVPKLLLDRGHAPQLLQAMEIGYDSRRSRAIFPIRMWTGELVAIQSRLVLQSNKERRWRFYEREVQEDLPRSIIRAYDLAEYTPGPARSAVFFNEHHVFVGLLEGSLRSPVVLVEGPGHALRVMAAGYPCLASFDSHLAQGTGGKGQLPRLVDTLTRTRIRWGYKPTLILASDGDRAGRESAFHTALRLGPGFDVRIADLPSGKDPEDLDTRQLRPLLAGAQSYATYAGRDDEVGNWARDVLVTHLEQGERRWR